MTPKWPQSGASVAQSDPKWIYTNFKVAQHSFKVIAATQEIYEKLTVDIEALVPPHSSLFSSLIPHSSSLCPHWKKRSFCFCLRSAWLPPSPQFQCCWSWKGGRIQKGTFLLLSRNHPCQDKQHWNRGRGESCWSQTKIKRAFLARTGPLIGGHMDVQYLGGKRPLSNQNYCLVEN